MRERSETFRALWDSHDVYDRVMGDKRLRVDGIGVLRLSFETFALAGPEGTCCTCTSPSPAAKTTKHCAASPERLIYDGGTRTWARIGHRRP
jgi:hypothetical protein